MGKLKISWQEFQIGSKKMPLPTVPACKSNPKVLKELYRLVDHYDKTGEMLKEIDV